MSNVGPNAGMYLHTSGNQLVTADGTPVLLHGINLGGWLETEAWMDGMNGYDMGGPGEDFYVLQQLEARPDIGTTEAATLIDEWRNNFITGPDIALIHSWGYNAIRVGLDYRDFQDASGAPILNAQGQIDYSRLDWILQEAASYGMYVIFDLHDMESQSQAQAMWMSIAQHFRGNGAIAGIDVINEPGSQFSLQTALYYAVRAGDPNRVVFVEPDYAWQGGVTTPAGANPNDPFVGGTSQYPAFENLGLTNVVYEVHYPDNTSHGPGSGQSPLTSAQVVQYLSQFADKKYPIYIGEIKAAQDDAADAEIQVLGYDQAHVSWSNWTYKTVGNGGWGLLDYYNPSSVVVNLQTSSYAQILASWGPASLDGWQTPGSPTYTNLESSLIMGYQSGNQQVP